MATRRRPRLRVDRQDIVERVLRFYSDDLTSHNVDRDARLQRYAKYRMWTSGKDWPWPDASDAAIPDMMEKSLRLQDTLHNAVMSQRPPISANAIRKQDREKERSVDRLIDYQVFAEQSGEITIGEMADAFVNDGVVTLFIPWVRELKEVTDIRLFPPIPPQMEPAEYFFAILRQNFTGVPEERGAEGWEWNVSEVGEEGEPVVKRVSFFSRDDGQIEMSQRREEVAFDGPKLIVKEYDEVLHPPRAANLQAPSPSNPNGAAHVILIDYPTIDEVKRLAKSKFYDIDADELERIGDAVRDTSDQERRDQEDDFSGTTDHPIQDKAKSHRTLTRLTCFDQFDIDGDGLDEDVIWWVIKETKTLAKARLLTEMYPASPPRRPFAESSFIPVKGRRKGISLLEMLEGIHDLIKQNFDQMSDFGTLTNAPFGFYRASSMVKPEVMRLWPGELYPLADPSRDINFPQFNNSGQAFGINMLTILGEMENRLTLQSELQSGSVPAGRASALRTTGNVSMLLGQGEARPERILRRFFIALSEAWAQIHELNQHFLPKDKQIRIIGLKQQGEDPYLTIKSADDIKGRFQFDFKANVFNTSKQAMQASLGTLLQTFISEISIQLGIIKPDGIFRLLRDFALAQGQDPDRYLSEPTPGAAKNPILAEEAISEILESSVPDGRPAEGAMEHLQKLSAFIQDDRFGLLTPAQVGLFQAYLQTVQQLAAEEAQQAMAIQAAQAFQGNGPARAGGRPQENPPTAGETQMLTGDELIDETLPSERGVQ